MILLSHTGFMKSSALLKREMYRTEGVPLSHPECPALVPKRNMYIRETKGGSLVRGIGVVLHFYTNLRYLMRPRMLIFTIIFPLNSRLGETCVSVLHTEMNAECPGTMCKEFAHCTDAETETQQG